MVRAVVQNDFHVLDFIPSKDAAFQGFLDPLFDRLDVFTRNGATDNRILKNEAVAGTARFDGDANVTVLASATGLPDVFTFGIGLHADCFFVGNLRLADVGADIELAHHSINDDFQ